MFLSVSKAEGISIGGGEVMPAEKALGSFLPLIRWKPRSPVSLAARDRLFLKTPPRSGANTGAVRLPSVIPPSPRPPAASAPVNAFMLAARFLYQRRMIIAINTKTAKPATPPTIPPASTEAGGVLSPLLLSEAAVLLAELGAVDVAELPMELPSELCAEPEVAEACELPVEDAAVASDEAPEEADDASEETRTAALLRALLAELKTEEAELRSAAASEEYELLAEPVAVEAAADMELNRALTSARSDDRAAEAEERLAYALPVIVGELEDVRPVDRG